MAKDSGLAFDVFVSEPLPLALGRPLPNGDSRLFSPLSSTLIYGERDALLADPPLDVGQVGKVGDWIEAHGKTLRHIFITHGHGDHWFGAGELVERFGGPQVVASAGTIAQMERNAATREVLWDKLFPGQMPATRVKAVTVPDNRFSLEGHEFVIVEVGHTDSDDSTVLHVPDLGLIVGGDVLYNGCHQYLAEFDNGGGGAWLEAIDTVEALSPRWAVAGHRNPHLDEAADRVITGTRAYLQEAGDLLAEHDSAVNFFNAIVERHPDYVGQTVLWIGVSALYAMRAGVDPTQAIVAAWLGD